MSTYPSARELLRLVTAAGALGMVFAFPGTALALAPFVLGKQTYSRWQTKYSLTRLHNQKYVSFNYNSDGSVTVRITKRGMERALTYQLDTLSLERPKQWDKKWRLVIFDIPEKYKRLRDVFRMRLKQLNLYQLQESVYISPYACFDQVEFLRELYGVSFTVKYVIATKVEDDALLKNHFSLSV